MTVNTILIRNEKKEIDLKEKVSLHIPEYNIIITESKLNPNISIWGNVNIYGATIGKNTKIGAFVEIRKGVKIGNNVKIEPFVFIPEGVTIEDCVFVGPNVCFTNDLYPKSCKEDGSLITEYPITPTIVRKGASIGAGSVIICGITIGEESMIGAGSTICDDVPPRIIIRGEKSKTIRNP